MRGGSASVFMDGGDNTQSAYTQERREAQRKIDEEILALKESQARQMNT
jgi:hypothetical protein